MADKFPQNIKGLLADSRTDKVYEQRFWDLSLRFLEGRQWLRFDRNLEQYVGSETRDGMPRVTINLLLNVYRNIQARLEVSYPSVVVLPASPSTEDVVKSRSAETALKYYWAAGRIEDVLGEAVRWLLTTGTAGLHTYYDPGLDEVRTSAHGAYDLFFERGVNSPSESQWVAIRTFHSKSALKEAYPGKGKIIDEATVINENDYSSFYNPNYHGPPVNRVEVFEIYWRDGKHAIMAGDQYLFKEKRLPIPELPVQVIRYTEIPRRLWGVSLLAPLIDLQRLYNKARSQVIHNVELMGNPKWIVPKTAGISNHSITSRPGEKVYFNPAGGAPQQIAPSPLPSYIIDNIQRIQSEMGDVAGVHSVSLGKRAVGVTSGKAIDALAGHDTSQLQGTQAAIERGVRDMARCALMLMQRFYTEEKMLRMLDESGRVTFQALQATDLDENPEVFIEAGSLFRDEAQDRDARVVELLQLGLIDPATAMQEISFRTGNAYVSKKVQAIAHAREILELAKEGVGEVQIFRNDDLDAMEEVFKEFMQTAPFYDLPEERQDYISEIMVSIIAAKMGANDAQYQDMLMNQTVFPRAPVPGSVGSQVAGMVAADSPTTQSQVAEQLAARNQKVGTIANSERLAANRGEAMISPAPGGVT